MTLFSALFAFNQQLTKELSVLGFCRYISTSEIVRFGRSPAIFEQARHQHTNASQSEQRNAQMRQIIDQLDEVTTYSQQQVNTSQVKTSQLQIAQLSEKLIQLALTATNLVRDLLQQNATITPQIQRQQMQMDETPAATVNRQKTKSDVRKERGGERMLRTWNCEKCHFANSFLRFACQGCEEGRPTDSQQMKIRQIMANVWQCVNCKMINNLGKKVCFECGTKMHFKEAYKRTNSADNEIGPNLSRIEMDDKKERWIRGDWFSQKADEGTTVEGAKAKKNKNENVAQKQQKEPLTFVSTETDKEQQMDDKNKLGQMFFGESQEKKQAMAK